MVRISVVSYAAIGSSNHSRWRIEDAGQSVKRNVADPLMSIVAAFNRQRPIARSTNWNCPGGLVANVSVYIRVDHVLCRRAKPRKRPSELLPISGGVEFAEGNGESFRIVGGPLQRNLPGLAWGEFGCDRPMAGREHIKFDVPRAFYTNHFMPPLRLLPSRRRQVLAALIEGLDENVFNVWAKICETPGDAAVMTNDHKRCSRQGYSGYIEFPGSQVGLVPGIRNVMSQMHVIREQRLSCSGMSAGDDPIVGAGDDQIIGL